MRREGRELKHTNRHYGFPVMTGQEERVRIPVMKSVEMKPDGVLRGPLPVSATTDGRCPG